VRALRAHIERTNQRGWIDVLGSQLHFSEFILYGVFVDEVLGGTPFTESTSLCHSY
jgi:hypothetical protein